MHLPLSKLRVSSLTLALTVLRIGRGRKRCYLFMPRHQKVWILDIVIQGPSSHFKSSMELRET